METVFKKRMEEGNIVIKKTTQKQQKKNRQVHKNNKRKTDRYTKTDTQIEQSLKGGWHSLVSGR